MIVCADARRIPLPDESVQCIVTSPPYWGLRKYSGEQELLWGGTEGCEHDWATEELSGDCRIAPGDFNSRVNGGNAKHREIPKWTAQRGCCQKCGAWRGAYGLEPTVEMYVQHTIEILREIRRVLRSDGIVFWNIGDSYQSGDRGTYMRSRVVSSKSLAYGKHQEPERAPNRFPQNGLKPKDLCLIPDRVRLAAQADGWWVRSKIIWAKPNPMPESCTDRPTDAYEDIIMLTKSPDYFWDADAVLEKAKYGYRDHGGADQWDHCGNSEEPPKHFSSTVSGGEGGTRNMRNVWEFADSRAFGYTPKGTHSRGSGDGGPKARARAAEGVHEGWTESTREIVENRNMRNVWMFATQPYKGAHFATFPEELPRRCILAATSSKGACEKCGAPWSRISESTRHFESGSGKADNPPAGKYAGSEQAESGDYDIRMGPVIDSRTVGWRPTCSCGGRAIREAACFSKRLEREWYRQRWQARMNAAWPGTIPCLVLDPFAGSGTTGRVAIELQRRAVLLDLAYHALAARRLRHTQINLFA